MKYNTFITVTKQYTNWALDAGHATELAAKGEGFVDVVGDMIFPTPTETTDDQSWGKVPPVPDCKKDTMVTVIEEEELDFVAYIDASECHDWVQRFVDANEAFGWNRIMLFTDLATGQTVSHRSHNEQ